MDFDGPLQANSFANAFNNNPLLLLRLAVKPLAQTPFPIERISQV